ncbi:imidazole glycerol phosphate synthase subunit HisH [Ornithinibacillus halophilus]|uniref:Imidazole glycerol phosphate synthase subunit HisH n=1 Tax=Ornithinibacillus halophilus TaxID=930117 RepID=A0A1M5H0R6_9BACI|nr:imidazole glycerol phosphate synthase subunit HisH [Ornithinibacillus halophilus]SHG09486.1 glutamine amidotransferase [Ornithinibacillus halophilus]
MIAIIDYGAGNLKSLQFALSKLNIDSCITTNQDVIESSNAIILPGVGAFEEAMLELQHANVVDVIKNEVNKGKMLLGICLGMQLLYENSSEDGFTEGLNLLQGSINRIPDTVKVPHMGWNTLSINQNRPIIKGLPENPYVYFVHSFYATNQNSKDLVSSTDYGVTIPAIVQKENIIGMQFHPEKSGRVGLQLLKNFGEMIS